MKKLIFLTVAVLQFILAGLVLGGFETDKITVFMLFLTFGMVLIKEALY